MENKYYNENYYNANTILKFLRKVLNEINKSYVDSGMRTAFLMKRYIEKYKIDTEHGHEHVLLCMLKDIGLFYMDGAVPSNDPALAAASSYAFLHQCSPLDANARPLLFYKARYMEDVNNFDYDLGLLMTLLDHVSLYIYQRKDVEEIEEILRADKKRKAYNPDQVKKVIKLLKDSPDIIEKLNSESELYVYETSRYISLANYKTDTLGEFLDTTSFMFEFHNHETMAHTVTTAQIAYDLAIDCKLTESTARAIEIAGKVHDIGKIRVPLEILCYPGKLTGEALDEMQMHAKYTKEIIEGCFSYVIVEIASRHHEKLDGSGYPLGITKKDLTSADKVLAVADICSALYCKRSYKEAFTPEKIQSILLSDAKAGKLDERIVNHLIDDYDRIMANAKAVEDNALRKYETMKDEYEALAKSPALRNVFGESEEIDEERPESIAAEETEEYISGVINYRKNDEEIEEIEEQIIYVDENGNEIDYNPEEFNQGEEATFEIEESIEDPLEAYNKEEMGDVPLEEVKVLEEDFIEEEEEPKEEKQEETQEEIDDEFDAFLSSIPEKEVTEEPKKKPFVPKVPLKHPSLSFDPFKEDIDPVFNEPILPKETHVETKEEIDQEFDAFLNSIPEKEVIKETLEEESLDNEKEIDEPKSLEEIMEEAFEEEKEIINDFNEEQEETDEFEEDTDSIEDIEETAFEEDIDDALEESKSIEEKEAIDEELEESDEAEEMETIDEEPEESDEVEDDIDDSIDSIAIDSKYEDSDEEIDSFSSFDEESIMEKKEKEDDYVTSYVEEEDFDLVVDEDASEAIIPDESKYDVDPEEEIDDSTGSVEEDSKEDDYVTSYVDEDEFEETVEEETKEDDYVTSYVDEDEFEEESKDALVEEKEETNDNYLELNETKEESLNEKESSNKKEEDEDLDDDDEDDEDEDEDDDEDDDSIEEEEDEEEDKDPKHKKFFSNDIYRKMFTYNPKNKKK